MRVNPAVFRMRKAHFADMVETLFDDVKQEVALSAAAQVRADLQRVVLTRDCHKHFKYHCELWIQRVYEDAKTSAFEVRRKKTVLDVDVVSSSARDLQTSLAQAMEEARLGTGPSSSPRRTEALVVITDRALRRSARACGILRTDKSAHDALRRAVGDFLCRVFFAVIDAVLKARRVRVSSDYVLEALRNYRRGVLH
jgi:histone H3/H4